MKGLKFKIGESNKALTILLTILLIAFILTSSIILSNSINKAEEAYADTDPTWTGKGSGSETDPYLITTAEELGTFRDIVNVTGAEKHAVLGNDITLSDDWDPIGPDDKPFKGTFDGNCHTVYGIKINQPTTGHVGFFANVTDCSSGTEIKNLTLKGSGITASSGVGGIVGYITGDNSTYIKITNCHNYVPIKGGYEVGGIVGYSFTGKVRIVGCSNQATITSKEASSNINYAGGIVGYASGSTRASIPMPVEIENCYNAANIDVTGGDSIGGIIGKADARVYVKKCFNYNSVKGATATNLGAIVGNPNPNSTGWSFDACHYLTISGSATDPKAEGHDAAWFKVKSNFTDVEYANRWDFTNTWEIKENANYPTFLPEVQVYIQGHIIAVGSYSDETAGHTYIYDRTENVLQLGTYENKFEIVTPSWIAGIYSELENLTINVKRDTVIDNQSSGEALTRYGIYSKHNLTFRMPEDGYFPILNIKGSKGRSLNFYGIYCEGNISVNSGYLNINAGDAYDDGTSTGIYAKSMIVNDGEVFSNGYDGNGYNDRKCTKIGIQTENGLSIESTNAVVVAWGYTTPIIGKVETVCSGAGYSYVPYCLTNATPSYGKTREETLENINILWENNSSDYPIGKGTYLKMEDERFTTTDSYITDPKYATLAFNLTPVHILAYLDYKRDEGYDYGEIHYNDETPTPENYIHRVYYSSEYLTEGDFFDYIESKVIVSSYYDKGDWGDFDLKNMHEEGDEVFTRGNYDYKRIMHGSFTVEKGIPDYYAPTPRKLLYTGEAQDLIVPGSWPANPNVQSTFEYKIGSSGTYSTAIPQGTEIQTYTVYYRVTPTDTSHYETVTKYFNVRIDLHDKTALEEALNTARYNRDLLHNGGLDTTNLDNAISSANNVFETGSATEEQINNAINNLNEVTTASTVGLYKTLIGGITLPITDLSKESDIKNLKALYGVMTDEQKAQLTQEEKDKLEPAVLQLAAELIKDIGDPKLVTSPESEGKIDNAKGFYNSLTDAQKAQISNAKNLEDAEDYLAVDDFKDKMDAIGDPKQVTSPESKTAIQDAKDALAELTDAQKALVDPNLIKDLSDAEDYFAADKAKDLINAIGTVEYPASSAAINAARDAYDALTDAQKALVDNYSNLENAENAYGDLAADDVADKINAIGDPKQVTSPESKDAIDAANNAYNQLPANQRGKIPADIRKNLEDANDYYAADGVKDLISAIGTVEYPTSKTAIDAAKGAYDQLTETQQGLIPDEDRQTLENAIDKYATDEAKDKIAQIGDPADVKHTNEYKEKIYAAKEVVDKLTPSQRSLIPSELANYEEALNRYEAEGAKDLISAIGNPADVKHTDAYKEKIDAARDAYDALNDAQKALVDNIDDLKAAVDQYEAQGAMDLINEIDNVSLDTQDKEKIDAAKEAYNKLTPEQKALIPDNIKNDFENIVDELNDLIKDDITSKVDDIGTVSYDEASKEKIDKAMEAYNNLTEEEKALIPQEVKDKLQEAYNTYDQMDVDATRSEITDEESGVKIETEGRGVPRNVSLKVEVKADVTPSKVSPEALNKLIKKTQKIAKIYDVKLIQTVDGVETEIQPSDIKEGMKIKIHMAIPEGVKTKGLNVLHIHGDGSVDVIDDVTIDGNTAIVEVASLSEFAIVEKTGHGFCIGWIVFIFMMLELLFACLYIILRYGFVKNIVAKCKLDCLYEKMNLLTFIGMCSSQVLFVFALIALCLHQCAVTIVSFIFVLLIMCAFEYFFLKDKGVIDGIFKDNSKNKNAIEDEQAKAENEENDKQQKEYARMSKWGLDAAENIEAQVDPDGVLAVGIIQNRKGKVYMFNPKDFVVKPGDVVEIVDIKGEHKAVSVVIGNHMAPKERIVEPFKDIVRVLYSADIQEQPKVEEATPIEAPVEETPKDVETLAAIEETETAAEEELAQEKEETIETIEAKEKAHQAITLKDSITLAKATGSSHRITKKTIANYLKTKDIVEVNERENRTRTGLPLPDTHYVDGKAGKKCFAYVYETEGSVILLAKMDSEYADKLQQSHSQINKSAFPKQRNTWYSLIIDDTYTEEEVESILDELIGEVKEGEGVSLKESIALAKANTSEQSFTKAYVCEYLKDRKDVEVNTRENYTKTGLPLADTHYVEKDGKKICFAYVYEIEGSIILLAKMNTRYATELKKKHPQVHLSAFPKQKDTWYSLIIDDTYTREDFDKIIDDISK